MGVKIFLDQELTQNTAQEESAGARIFGDSAYLISIAVQLGYETI